MASNVEELIQTPIRGHVTSALVVHPGTQHAFQLAIELHRLNALAGLHTGFAAAKGGVWEALIDAPLFPLRRLVSNRRVRGVPVKLLKMQVGLELASQARRLA